MQSRLLLKLCVTVGVLLSTMCLAGYAKPAAPKSASKQPVKPQISIESIDPKAKDEYLTKLKEKVMRFWTPAKGEAAQVTVTMRIHKDGHTSWVRLKPKSSIDAVNQAAEDALTYAGKFSNLPNGFPEVIDVQLDFNSDYNPTSGIGYSRPGRTILEKAANLYSAGITRQHQGNMDGAIEQLNQAIELTPHDGRVRDALVKLYMEKASTQQGDSALETLHKALLLDARRAKIRTRYNEVLAQLGKKDDFAEHVAMARNYVSQDKLDDAISEYGEAWTKEKKPEVIIEINAACKLKKNTAAFIKWESAAKEHKSADVKTAFEQARLAYEPLRDSFKKYVADLTASTQAKASSDSQTSTGAATEEAKAPSDSQASTDAQPSSESNPANESKLSSAAQESLAELQRYANKDNVSDDFPYAENASMFVTAKLIPLRQVVVSTLMDFTADWCGPSRWLLPHLDQIAKEYKGTIKVMRIDIDANKAMAALYGVSAIPHLVLVRGEDKKRFESVGYMELDKLRAFVKNALIAP